MVIKRGGPGGPRVPPRPQGEQRSAGVASGREPARADEARPAATFDTDGFDDDLGVQRSTPGDRAEDVFRSEARSSSVKNTERLLETTYERLASEYRAVHAEARALVQELAAQGFSADAVAEAGPDLRGHRARMTKLRGRLANIRRRLRTISLPAGSALDLQLEQRLGAQIRAVSELERGVDRSLMALQLATTFRPRAADGKPAALVRIDVERQGDRAALGSELARAAPDATTTDTLLRLLSGRARSDGGTKGGEGKRGVQALRAFAAAQIGT